MPRMTGGEALAKSLSREGVRVIFGLPGVQIYGAMASLRDEPGIRFIATRHEQATSYMADGYARAGGGFGTALVVPGPGLLNASAGLSTAYSASSPVLMISGQIPRGNIGKKVGVLHEVDDQLDAIRPITKWRRRVLEVSEIPAAVHEAVFQLKTGRPRPVEIELSLETMEEEGEVELLQPSHPLRPAASADGHGRGNASLGSAPPHLCRRWRAPLGRPRGARGRGRAPPGRRRHLGRRQRRVERRERPVARRRALAADPVAGICGFCGPGPRGRHQACARRPPAGSAGRPDRHRRRGDRQEPQEDLRPRGRCQGHARSALEAAPGRGAPTPFSKGRAASHADRDRGDPGAPGVHPQGPAAWDPGGGHRRGGQHPDRLLLASVLARLPAADLTSSYSGNLGYAYPTALGAKVACADRPVVSISGDGGFLYNSQELATAVKYGINVVAVVFNDDSYGNVARDLDESWGGSYGADLVNPDFMKLADAYGLVGMRAKQPTDVGDLVRDAVRLDRPVLIEVPVGRMPRPPFFTMGQPRRW